MRGNPFLTSDTATGSSMADLSMTDRSWANNEEPKKDKFIVEAELLIPGKGDPIKNGSIVVDGNKITKVGNSSSIIVEFSHLPKYNVKVLMPGMWDCHVHFIAVQAVAWDAILQSQQKQALTGARCAPDLMRLLDAGFTSVREMAASLTTRVTFVGRYEFH